MEETFKIDTVAFKNAGLALKAIDHGVRKRILRLLEEETRLKVTDIHVKLRLDQSIASQHLGLLRRANVVSTERGGRSIWYSLNRDRINEIASFANDMTRDQQMTN